MNNKKVVYIIRAGDQELYYASDLGSAMQFVAGYRKQHPEDKRDIIIRKIPEEGEFIWVNKAY